MPPNFDELKRLRKMVYSFTKFTNEQWAYLDDEDTQSRYHELREAVHLASQDERFDFFVPPISYTAHSEKVTLSRKSAARILKAAFELRDYLDTICSSARSKNDISSSAPRNPLLELAALSSAMCQYFSIEDLKVLCANLGVEYEMVSGNENKEVKSLELVKYFYRNSQMRSLLQELNKSRPNVSWLDMYPLV